MSTEDTAAGDAGTDQTKSLSERIHGVRTALFDITAVVDLAARVIRAGDDWCLNHALERAVERLGGACLDLELIALDARELQGGAP
ncbi:hypothetical protein [Steroidobacter cummioxidans]|uniref:hypothetical protein n=1 Tax=Steroidobacter cummioxidans TaxID=1803913 RepID=UPI000E312C41|nr:hypothetical protein [Steroidobacter cummioxidans]